MLIVITIAVLSVLGTALLAMSLMNINMKYNDYRAKQTLYYSESGIDQVYAAIGIQVDTVIGDAVTATEAEMNLIYNIISDTEAMTTLGQWPVYGKFLIPSTAGAPNYLFNNVELEKESKERFKVNFKTLMDTRFLADDMKDLIENTYVALDTSNSTVDITVDVTDIIPFAAGNLNTYEIRNITSTSVLNNNTERIIETDIIISDDVTAYPISTTQSRITVPDNPIWQKTLVSYGDQFILGSNTTINGDVYAYGTTPLLTNSLAWRDPENFGGFVVRGGSGLTLNGNLSTHSYVQLDNGASNMTVNNGLVYANSLVVQGDASGTLTINGNLYTTDDIELNGNGGRIVVNGSYYGYTIGDAAGVTHDKSSAIVLNADMNTGNSSIRITGTAPTGVAFNESNPGVLIGGTAYVNVDGISSEGLTHHFPYQTAESIALRGNYMSYTWKFAQEIVDDLKSKNILGGTYGLPYANSRIDSHLFEDNVRTAGITQDPTIRFVVEDTSGTPYNIDDRKAYFLTFKHYVDGGTGVFTNSGLPGTVNLSNYLYTTGLQVYTSGGANNYRNSVNAISLAEFRTIVAKIANDYLYNIHQMRHVNTVGLSDDEVLNRIDRRDFNGDGTIQIGNNPATDDIPYLNNINVVNKYTKLDTDTHNLKLITSKTSARGGSVDATEVIYLSNATGQDVNIYGTGVTVGVDEPGRITLNAGHTRMQGIIATRGNVYIHGNLDFTGVIIAGGDIRIEGGSKQFYNNTPEIKAYLAKLIHSNNQLYDVFNVSTFAGTGSGLVNLGVPLEFSETLAIAQAPNSNIRYSYKDLVYFKQWKVVK